MTMASIDDLAVTVGTHGTAIDNLEKRVDQHCAESAAEKIARDGFEDKILNEALRRLTPTTTAIIAILSSATTGLLVAMVRR